MKIIHLDFYSVQKMLIEAVESSHNFFSRIDDKELNDLLTKSNRADWKLIIKLNEANALNSLGSIYSFLKEWEESKRYNELQVKAIQEIFQNPSAVFW